MKVGGKSNLLGQSLHKKRVDPPQDWFEKKNEKKKRKTWPLFYCFVRPMWTP